MLYFSGRVIEHICQTRDTEVGAEVASIAQQRLAATPVSNHSEWA